MKIREITRELIHQLEIKSGYQVTFLEDSKLPTLAKIKIARGNLPGHILSYNPSPGFEPDYAICWQCVFAMRLFECPQNQQFQITSSLFGEARVEELILQGIGQNFQFQKNQLDSLKEQLLSGLITHLRSVPIGFRVVSWLDDHYPELNDLKQKFAEQELKSGIDSLDPIIKKVMPSIIFNSTTYINAAHATFWANHLNNPKLINPYRSVGAVAQGTKLLEMTENIPSDPIHDKDLIDNWASYLKIQDWYEWVPYLAP